MHDLVALSSGGRAENYWLTRRRGGRGGAYVQWIGDASRWSVASVDSPAASQGKPCLAIRIYTCIFTCDTPGIREKASEISFFADSTSSTRH